MLKIQKIEDKKTWEDFLFLSKIDFYPLFQSWNWGEVQKKLGKEILRIGLSDPKAGLIGVSLIIDIKAKRGHYLHLRHGPVLLRFTNSYFDKILNYVKEIAKKRGASFIRISPLIKKDYSLLLKQKGFLSAPIHNMDAETCLILDIAKPEEELLKEMRKTHRYLIKKAQNMDIKIIRTQKVSDITPFIDLYKDLSERQHFVPHAGVKEELEIFAKDDEALLFLAQYQQEVISAALILFIGNMAIYHHGASSFEHREIPVSYLLQWEAILEAKRRGKKLYNFWGIVPEDAKNHPWQGLTLFKTGFGGEKREFLHAQDLPLNLWYWKTYLIEYATKLLKGY